MLREEAIRDPVGCEVEKGHCWICLSGRVTGDCAGRVTGDYAGRVTGDYAGMG